MKRVDPQQYLERIKRKFDIDNIYDLDVDFINQQPREYDRRVEVAKLFIPEIEQAGPYDVRYDLAATIVLLLMPNNQKQKILESLSGYYGIPVFFPYTIENHNFLYKVGSTAYHPALPAVFFSYISGPEGRIEDFSELLFSIRCSQGVLSLNQFMKIFNYYIFKQEFNISELEIQILDNMMPFYLHTMEELGIFLQNKYRQNLDMSQNLIKIMDLIRKMNRDYRTVRRHAQQLRAKPMRIALWVDMHFLDLESIHIIMPAERKMHVDSIYQYIAYEMASPEKIETDIVFTVPRKQLPAFVNMIGASLRKDYNVYAVYTIPAINYNFRFLNPQRNAFKINWEEVETHFTACDVKPTEEEYVPVRPEKGEIDQLTLKIWEYLSGDVNIVDTALQKLLKAIPQKISARRRMLRRTGLLFPYIYNLNCPEMYLLRVNAKLTTLNYIIKLLSIFPCVYYFFYENLVKKEDKVLSAWIHLPTSDYQLFKSILKIKLPRYELSYLRNQNYQIGFHLWEIFDDKAGNYNYDLNQIHLLTEK